MLVAPNPCRAISFQVLSRISSRRVSLSLRLGNGCSPLIPDCIPQRIGLGVKACRLESACILFSTTVETGKQEDVMPQVKPSRTIIVGAGFAGLVAARELAWAGHSPLVLEARD